ATAYNSFQNGVWVQYALPKFMTLSGTFEKVVYDSDSSESVIDANGKSRPLFRAGDEVIIEGDNLPPHRLFLGYAIACGNLAVRPVFLAPVLDNQAWNEQPFRSYESDLDYICLKFVDSNDGVSKWFCGPGNLGDGVTGVASIHSSPRTFLLNSFQWGPNT